MPNKNIKVTYRWAINAWRISSKRKEDFHEYLRAMCITDPTLGEWRN